MNYEFHPYCTVYPEIDNKDYAELVKSIETIGLLDPITLYEEKILDGRNRYLACFDAGVEPRFDRPTINDPIGFVRAKNEHRRHLTVAQRAAVAADLANMTLSDAGKKGNVERWGSPTGTPVGYKISQKEAAEKMDVSKDSVHRANFIKQNDEKLFKDLKQGKTSIRSAEQKIRNKINEQKKKKEKEGKEGKEEKVESKISAEEQNKINKKLEKEVEEKIKQEQKFNKEKPDFYKLLYTIGIDFHRSKITKDFYNIISRSLKRKHHPDKGGDQEKFVNISETLNYLEEYVDE